MMHRMAKAVVIAGLMGSVCGCSVNIQAHADPMSVVSPAAPVDPFAAVRPATASVGVTMPDATDFQHPWDISTYVLRVTQFGHMAMLNGGIAFVGDSLTDWGRWNEMFPDQKVRNFGIAGDTTVGLKARLGQVIAAKPEKVFLLIGTNDVEFGRLTPEGIVANIATMVDTMKADLPGVKIYVESLLPREAKWDEKVRSVNALLKPAAEQRGAAYIDLYPLFAKNGRLDPSVTPDDIHLSGDGYIRWRDAIRPYIGNT